MMLLSFNGNWKENKIYDLKSKAIHKHFNACTAESWDLFNCFEHDIVCLVQSTDFVVSSNVATNRHRLGR